MHCYLHFKLTLSKTTLLGSFIISVIVGSEELEADSVTNEGKPVTIFVVEVGVAILVVDTGIGLLFEDTCRDAITGGGGISTSFSWIMRPPRLEVFSTCKAIDIPCSFFPKP